MRRKQILVVGFNGDTCTEIASKAAYEVGFEIARTGAVLITGGLGGVMEAASRGAKEAGGFVIGIIPQDNKDEANSYCDVVIATGIGYARDFVTASTADAVVVVGGGAGTLIEVSAAYQKRIPIVAVKGTGGIADRCGDGYIDDRKLERIILAESPAAAVKSAVNLG
ncbi:MAG TPA: TIGR00725 family protein [Candidatus Saccharimonadales bacterium]|nr:TIGR00725 family protein [Candidatus Saccharimonadales bacterium]